MPRLDRWRAWSYELPALKSRSSGRSDQKCAGGLCQRHRPDAFAQPAGNTATDASFVDITWIAVVGDSERPLAVSGCSDSRARRLGRSRPERGIRRRRGVRRVSEVWALGMSYRTCWIDPATRKMPPGPSCLRRSGWAHAGSPPRGDGEEGRASRIRLGMPDLFIVASRRAHAAVIKSSARCLGEVSSNERCTWLVRVVYSRPKSWCPAIALIRRPLGAWAVAGGDARVPAASEDRQHPLDRALTVSPRACTCVVVDHPQVAQHAMFERRR